MKIDDWPIRHWYSPAADEAGADAAGFLQRLKSPVRLFFPGADSSRRRAVVTLLHGNEPSGVKAIHRLIREGVRPAVDIYCFVISVTAALSPPVFTKRQLPGLRDPNRCFQPPFDRDEQGLISGALLEELAEIGPEVVIDVHNTSGEGPAFAVSSNYGSGYVDRLDPVVSLFSNRLIVTDMRLGALMEIGTVEMPVVTIECGGASEETADRIAYEGMLRFFMGTSPLQADESDWGLDVYYNPVRLELREDGVVAYGEAWQPGSDLTLKVDIEHHNFGRVDPDTPLGWVAAGWERKVGVWDAAGRNHLEFYYHERDGMLYPRCEQKLFMITSNPLIARSDCLWYAVTGQRADEG